MNEIQLTFDNFYQNSQDLTKSLIHIIKYIYTTNNTELQEYLLNELEIYDDQQINIQYFINHLDNYNSKYIPILNKNNNKCKKIIKDIIVDIYTSNIKLDNIIYSYIYKSDIDPQVLRHIIHKAFWFDINKYYTNVPILIDLIKFNYYTSFDILFEKFNDKILEINKKKLFNYAYFNHKIDFIKLFIEKYKIIYPSSGKNYLLINDLELLKYTLEQEGYTLNDLISAVDIMTSKNYSSEVINLLKKYL